MNGNALWMPPGTPRTRELVEARTLSWSKSAGPRGGILPTVVILRCAQSDHEMSLVACRGMTANCSIRRAAVVALGVSVLKGLVR